MKKLKTKVSFGKDDSKTPVKAKTPVKPPKKPLVEKPVETLEPQEECTFPAFELALDTKYLFEKDNQDFIASICSFDPVRVTKHGVRNGCQFEEELAIVSLSEYLISPLSAQAIAERLTNAGNF